MVEDGNWRWYMCCGNGGEGGSGPCPSGLWDMCMREVKVGVE